ncbi:MAG TPA: malonyl-ACP O-methyltransferase BioC [Paludibacteraceae bacterium]|nr:malonyl-ACP O-methyltransferase BioC [Paludibacteraceae bacterium]
MELVAENLVERRFSRARMSYGHSALAQRSIAESLVEMLPLCSVESVLEIGCGTGFLTRTLLQKRTPSVLHLNDISSGFDSAFCDLQGFQDFRCICGDAEKYPWPRQYDWVLSSSAIQWFSDFRTFVPRIAHYINDGGLLAFSTFGQKNMQEIRAVEGVGLDYFTQEDLEKCLMSNFRTLECREETIELTFDSPHQVLRHLRDTGVNALVSELWTPSRLRRFESTYEQLFSKDGKVTLTYHPIYYVGRKI